MIHLKQRKEIVAFIASILLSLVPATAQMVTTYEGEMGHTVAFDVASFTDVRDKSLSDVLGKMPGVKADEDVSYNGMDVGEIYVNGNNLRSSFSMVSGMKPEEIEKVEFIENFQSVEVLQGKVFNSDVAMNIVLKAGAKSEWSGTAKVGSGWSPTLYDADLYALRIGEKTQTMLNFMANNTCLDLENSISSFSTDAIGISADDFSMSDHIDIKGSGSPLPDSRTRLNNSYMLNMVNSTKLSSNYQLYTQLSYLHDKNESESSEEKISFLSDGSSVQEISHELASNGEDEIEADIALISNTDRYYLVNHIEAELSWKDVEMNLSGTYPNTQSGSINSIAAKDDFRFLKPLGDWTLTLFSQNQILSTPQIISVTRDGTSQHQDIQSRALFSDTKASFGYTSGGWTISLVGGFKALGRDLITEMQGVTDLTIENNDSRFGYVRAYAQPTANYVSEKLLFQVELPVGFNHYWFDERLSGDDSTKNITSFEPSFELKYHVNSLLSLTLNVEIDNDDVDASTFYTGMILTNYRNIRKGSLRYDPDGEKDFKLKYAFKLPQYSLFMEGQIGYEISTSSYRTFNTFVGDYVLRGYRPQKTTSDELGTYIDINKGISFLKGSIGLYMSFEDESQTIIRNDERIDYKNQYIYISPSIKGRLTPWMIVDYVFDLNSSRALMEDNDTKSISTEYQQSLEFVITPTDKLNFSLSGEHYHTIISDDKIKNLFLADFKVEYQFTKRWQAIASVTNILNQQDYSYTVISDDLTTTFNSYRIRPRNFLLSLYYKF